MSGVVEWMSIISKLCEILEKNSLKLGRNFDDFFGISFIVANEAWREASLVIDERYSEAHIAVTNDHRLTACLPLAVRYYQVVSTMVTKNKYCPKRILASLHSTIVDALEIDH